MTFTQAVRAPRPLLVLIFCVVPLLVGGWMIDAKRFAIQVKDPINWQSVNTYLGHRCVGETKRISGVIKGYDGHAVNALIGMDLLGPDGKTPIDGGGCSGSQKAKGYGVTVRVNYSMHPAGRNVDKRDARLAWFADIPATASKAYFEVYPKEQAASPRYGNTIHTYYGNAMRPTINIGPRGGTISEILLPAVKCGNLATGTLTGRFFKNGKIVDGVYVSAFAQTDSSGTPHGRGPFGFGVWRSAGTHAFELDALASGGNAKGQAYTLFGRLADGTAKKFYMAQYGKQTTGIKPCQRTYLDLHF